MIYAVSDIHGCYEKYKDLLSKIRLSDGDRLYVLGDTVDRGEDGVKILLDLMERKNAVCLRGNHDHEAMVFLKNFAMQSDGYGSEAMAEAFRLWYSCGGKPTFEGFMKLGENEKRRVLAFLGSMPFYEKVRVGGGRFFLSHTVPEREKMLRFEDCRLHDLIIGEPEYEKRYFYDTFIVTGHTPTEFIDEKSTGRIWKGNGHIAIDCGAVFGNPLGCVCLDTMEEIYSKE